MNILKSCPDFSIIAGNPAKLIRSFSSSEEIENYFRTKQKLK
jgi:hypothetical protein